MSSAKGLDSGFFYKHYQLSALNSRLYFLGNLGGVSPTIASSIAFLSLFLKVTWVVSISLRMHPTAQISPAYVAYSPKNDSGGM